MLERSGMVMPRATKTGTTIAGVVWKDGVVLGADTRATEVGGKTGLGRSWSWGWLSDSRILNRALPLHLFL